MTEYSVLKFGGQSATAPEQMAEIFTDDPARNRLAMVSAVGEQPDEPNSEKVTNMLIGLEEAVSQDDIAGIKEIQEAVIERYRSTYSPVLGEKVLQACLDRAYTQMQPEERNNGYRWIGEDLSARLFSSLTGALLISSGLRFRDGSLRIEDSLHQIYRRAAESFGPGGRQVIMPAYFGYDENGRVATLPRGGSDISAVLATAAMRRGSRLNWVHENYTHKDGVMTADPEIVPSALVISVMTNEEARELMHGVIDRNGVIHGDAIALAARYGITLIVRNTFNPDSPGTRIVSSRESEGQPPVIGISGKSGITALNVYDVGMAEASNYLTPILTRVGDAGLSISSIPMSEDGLKLIFNGDVPEQSLRDIASFIKNRAISGPAAEVTPVRNEGGVYLVGQELRRPAVYTETVGRVATSLLADNLGFSEVISRQNSPGMAITLDDGNDVPATIQTIHKQYFEEA